MKKATSKKPKVGKAKVTTSTATLPAIPIGHLTIQEFEELRDHIERITGHKVVLELSDKNGTVFGTL